MDRSAAFTQVLELLESGGARLWRGEWVLLRPCLSHCIAHAQLADFDKLRLCCLFALRFERDGRSMLGQLRA